MKAVTPNKPAGKPELCVWKYDQVHEKWDTDCGKGFYFFEDGPVENNYDFCPGCGRTIEVKGER